MKSPKIVISAGLNQNIDNYINALELFNTNIVIANAITKTKILKNKYESTIDTSLGFIILIVKVSVEDIGKIIHGDSSTYHKVDFSVLTFFPKIQEIVEGELIEITDYLTKYLVQQAEEFVTQFPQILLMKHHSQYLFL